MTSGRDPPRTTNATTCKRPIPAYSWQPCSVSLTLCALRYSDYEDSQRSEADQQHATEYFRQVDTEVLNVSQHQLSHAVSMEEFLTIAAMLVD